MKLSACMIVKNEEHTLKRALDSIAQLADEIIIVDTGSTDKTTTIAQHYTNNIYHYAWNNNFSDARNYSLSKATGDWTLVLDADEMIAREDHEAIRKLITNNDFIAYAFPQISYTNDTTQYNYTPITPHHKYEAYANNFTGYISCNIVRLFRNKNIHFTGAVHESADDSCKAQGNISTTDIWIHHYQFERGQEHLKQKQLAYLRIYEDNLDTYHDKARAHRDIGSIYYTYLQDYDTAITHFKQSLNLNKNNKKTHIGIGLCYLQKKQFNNAHATFNNALTLFPNDQQLHHLIIYTRQFIERFIKD